MAQLIMGDGSVMNAQEISAALDEPQPASVHGSGLPSRLLTSEDFGESPLAKSLPSVEKSMEPMGSRQGPRDGSGPNTNCPLKEEAGERLCKKCGAKLAKADGGYCQKCLAAQMTSKSLDTAGLDQLEQLSKGGGEGSKGGTVIGHTASGKPIYRSSKSTSHFKAQHEGWSLQDHKDAQDAHAAHMDKVQQLAKPYREAIDMAGADQGKRAEAFKKLDAVKDEHNHAGSQAKYHDHGKAIRRLQSAARKTTKSLSTVGLDQLEDHLAKAVTPVGGKTPAGYTVKMVGGKRQYVKEGEARPAADKKQVEKLPSLSELQAEPEDTVYRFTGANGDIFQAVKADAGDRWMLFRNRSKEKGLHSSSWISDLLIGADRKGWRDSIRVDRPEAEKRRSDMPELVSQAGGKKQSYKDKIADLHSEFRALANAGDQRGYEKDWEIAASYHERAASRADELVKLSRAKIDKEFFKDQAQRERHKAFMARKDYAKPEAQREVEEIERTAAQEKGEEVSVTKWRPMMGEKTRAALKTMPVKELEALKRTKLDLLEQFEAKRGRKVGGPATDYPAEHGQRMADIALIDAEIEGRFNPVAGKKQEGAESAQTKGLAEWEEREVHRAAYEQHMKAAERADNPEAKAHAYDAAAEAATKVGSKIAAGNSEMFSWAAKTREAINRAADMRAKAKTAKRKAENTRQLALFRSMGYADLDDFLAKSEAPDEELVKFLGKTPAPQHQSSGGYQVGKRGGHIIGKTSSGKPIYADKSPGSHSAEYKDWSAADHHQAENAHRHWAEHARKHGGAEASQRQQQHTTAAAYHSWFSGDKTKGGGSDWAPLESKAAGHYAKWEHDAAAKKFSRAADEHYSAYARSQESGKGEKQGKAHPSYRAWSETSGKAAEHRKHKDAKEKGQAYEGASLAGRMKRKLRQELFERSQTATESSMNTLEEFLVKAEQGMPEGDPNQDLGKRRAEDGMGLEGAPKPTGSSDSGASPAIGAPAPSKDKLSEDDAEDEKQMREHKKPIEGGGTAVPLGKSLPASGAYGWEHLAQTYAHEDAVARSRLSKGELDVQPDLAPPQDSGEDAQLEKARHFSTFGGAVHVSNQADLDCERLQKSESFWHGEAPGLSPVLAPIHQVRRCSCGALVKSYLTACPNCASGAVESRVFPTEVGGPILEKSDGSVVLRPRRQPPDIYIPDKPTED